VWPNGLDLMGQMRGERSGRSADNREWKSPPTQRANLDRHLDEQIDYQVRCQLETGGKLLAKKGRPFSGLWPPFGLHWTPLSLTG